MRAQSDDDEEEEEYDDDDEDEDDDVSITSGVALAKQQSDQMHRTLATKRKRATKGAASMCSSYSASPTGTPPTGGMAPPV